MYSPRYNEQLVVVLMTSILQRPSTNGVLIPQLCERDINKRLGCTPEGIDGLKKHPWFQGIEWDELVTKEAVPPFEPDVRYSWGVFKL